MVLVVGQPVHRRLAGLEATEAARDGDDRSAVHGPAVGGQDELALVVLLDGLCPLAEGKARLEWRRLLHQAVDQVTREDFRVGRDVENGLLRVDLGTLASRLGQGVNEVTLELQEPGFEHGEESAGTGTDDEDVRLDHEVLAAKVGLNAFRACNNLKAGVFKPGRTRAC